ncbi:DUF2259 domain-containing protein [Aureimonas populi]|uniref:DUF2259 domain-containing protein n=1 Tax=Aureimonas populi TaxID=1701758 RepID=A0ABW5CP97_9HYPH|nr:DUF2259 domain-containing protein [Aureimonas populi]
MRLMLASLTAFLAAPALAGDFATLNPLGFSADGRVFAFEQYGIQDGSGFPYAEIFVLDLDEDRYLAPSPVRVRLDDEGAHLDAARRQAREAAAGLLSAHEPKAEFGLIVASSPPTELSADPHRVEFLPRAIEPRIDEPVELRLSLLPRPDAPEFCTAFGHGISGFRLVRVAAGPGETARVLHEDETLPDSRACAFDYRIAQVQVHGTATGRMRAVALIGVKQVGFEGPDMRYIAVPVPLD